MADLLRFHDCIALYEYRLNVQNHENAAIPISNHNGLNLSRRCGRRHLAAKVGTSKGGGKQWQATPKNLPRMQCARAIPVT